MNGKKKYVIKESELKELIREFILTEVMDTSAYNNNYTLRRQAQIQNGENVGLQPKDILNSLGGLVKGAVPDNWKDWFNKKGWFDGMGLGAAGFLSHKDGGNGEVFNVPAAISKLKSMATPYYDPERNKRCAEKVNIGLRAGGLDAPWGHRVRAAKDYLGILPYNGWHEIPINQAGLPGDLVVLAPYTTPETGKKHEFGHVAMCCGNGLWISDFVQANMYGVKGSIPPGVAHTFRHNSIEQN